MNTREDFVAEARRCLQCKNAPCVVACPAHNPIPRFMKAVREGGFAEAKTIWDETSVLPEICGRLCQNETLCVGHCTMNKLGAPLKIGELEAAVSDLFPLDIPSMSPPNGRRHLVIGLGPAGLSNAMEMAKMGYFVDAIDANPDLGGALINLIPGFRFDHRILERIRHKVEAMGIRIQYGVEVGKTVLLSELLPRYDSVFIACGSDLPQGAEIETHGVPLWYAHDLLDRQRYQPSDLKEMLGKAVAVVGLGNVAVDMARVLVRLGKRVTIVYRRSVNEAPAGRHEIQAARDEGIEIRELRLPRSCSIASGKRSLLCDRTAVVVALDGTKTIETVPGSGERIELDDLVYATGQRSSDTVFNGTDLVLRPDLSPYSTSNPNVFVGGDRVNRHKRIVDAMVSGIEAAKLCQGGSR
ncbi:MAG TPA: FAD-dependent oxidoreductase [Bacillota bacterium]|nr:FAD-dependent oxidoreductase [Bacillota bacterium]